MSENSPLDDIACLIAAFEEQKKTIYAHYSQAVASVMTGRITAENEIERIMDGLLDFADDELFSFCTRNCAAMCITHIRGWSANTSPSSECNLKMERMTMKTSDNIYEIVPVKN